MKDFAETLMEIAAVIVLLPLLAVGWGLILLIHSIAKLIEEKP